MLIINQPQIMKRILYISIMFLLITTIGCSNKENLIEIEESTDNSPCTLMSVDPNNLINGDQLPIVAGKLLSYAVSSEDECAYMPPGKWVNLYGMVYYRYTERGSGNDKLSVNGLVKESAEAVASILNKDQLAEIISIISQQLIWENQARNNRDLISRELYKWKSGIEGDENLILNLTKENGVLLKNIIHQRTTIYATVMKELSDEQKNNFCLSRTLENNEINPNDLKNLKNQLNNDDEKTTLNLILSKFFVWATGTEEMNQLVDDGRPAVYFGFANLRIEDREGNNVSNGLRKEASDLISNTMNSSQKTTLNNLVSLQENYISTYFLTRANLASKLVEYLSNDSPINTYELLDLCTNSEIAESQLAILQAKEMGNIIQSLDATQLQILIDFKEGN